MWLGGEFLYRIDELRPDLDEGRRSAHAGRRPRQRPCRVAGAQRASSSSARDKGDIVLITQRDGERSRRDRCSRPPARATAGSHRSPSIRASQDVVYATYGNFGGAHVFRSTDGGATWQSIDGSGAGALPDIPVHSIVVDPDDSQRLYLGTDLGVMVSIDGGRTWMAKKRASARR